MGSLLLHYLNVWNSCFAPLLPVQHAHICSINCCIHSFNPKILHGIIIYHFTERSIAGWYPDITGIPWSWTSPNSKLPVDMISHHLVVHIVANATTPGARHAVHLVAERPSNATKDHGKDSTFAEKGNHFSLNLLKLWQVLHPKKFELWAPCLEKRSLKARHFQLCSPIHLFACIFSWNIAFASSFLWLVKQISKNRHRKGCHSEFILAPESPEKAGYLRMFSAHGGCSLAVLLSVGCFPCLRYPEGLGCFVCPGDKNRYLDVTITIAFVCIVLNPWESKAAEFATHVVRCRSGLKISNCICVWRIAIPKSSALWKLEITVSCFLGHWF